MLQHSLLTKIKYIQLYLLGKLNLDVANNQERCRKLDVDATICPPHLIDLGHEGTHRGLAHLKLKQDNYKPNITSCYHAQLLNGLNGKCVNNYLDFFYLESDH